jgi:hypothetical protein
VAFAALVFSIFIRYARHSRSLGPLGCVCWRYVHARRIHLHVV